MSSPHTEGLEISAAWSQEAERLVLRLDGELDLTTAAILRAQLRAVEGRSVVVDLGGVTFLDSTGLALLLHERARALRRGSSFRAGGASGRTRALLERTGTLTFLDVATAAD